MGRLTQPILNRKFIWFILGAVSVKLIQFIATDQTHLVDIPPTRKVPETVRDVKHTENVKDSRIKYGIEAAYPPLDADDMKASTVKRRLADYIDENKAFGMRQRLLNAGFTPYLITLTYTDGFNQNQDMRRRPDGTNSIPLQGTCAVVGSAGILQNSSCGNDIDEHDFVFRGNLATTIGFEQDVGRRTDLMVLNGAASIASSKCLTNTSALCHRKVYKTFNDLNDTYLWISKLDASRNISYAHDLVAGVKQNNLLVRIVYPYTGLLGPISKFWKIRNPSLGLIMYTAAASMCRRVSLYGFYPFYKLPNGESIKHHYYDNRSLNYTTQHHMPVEYKMFKSLNESRIIRLVTDKCRPSD